MFHLQKLIIFCVLLFALRVESTGKQSSKHSPVNFKSFQASLRHIITARKTPGEMMIAPNTLTCFETTPADFQTACLEAYGERIIAFGLDVDTPNNEEELGILAFRALEDVCNRTIEEHIESCARDSSVTKELETLLTRGDILCFFSFGNNHAIAEEQLEAEMKRLKDKHGFMSDEEAELQVIFNHYNLTPTKCTSSSSKVGANECA